LRLTAQEIDSTPACRRCKFFLLLLVVCVALVGLFQLLQTSKAEAAAKRIVISAADIAHMREVWVAQRGVPPSSTQINAMIDAAVREQLLYREALALKLEQDDAMVRKRLAQRMELRLRNADTPTKPTEAELTDYLQRNADEFKIPAKVAFTHVYFNHKKDRVKAKADAEKVLIALRAKKHPPDRASQMGESFFLPADFNPKSKLELAELFGPQFADVMFELTPGQWEGPIASSYGYHLVRITERTEPRMSTMDEVRDRVAAELVASRGRAAEVAQYSALRSRYKIVIEQSTLEGQGSR
jgi:peptidyl-prolyl cis-trans isomerase C